jgi:hypothetical protein
MWLAMVQVTEEVFLEHTTAIGINGYSRTVDWVDHRGIRQWLGKPTTGTDVANTGRAESIGDTLHHQ